MAQSISLSVDEVRCGLPGTLVISRLNVLREQPQCGFRISINGEGVLFPSGHTLDNVHIGIPRHEDLLIADGDEPGSPALFRTRLFADKGDHLCATFFFRCGVRTRDLDFHRLYFVEKCD